MPQKRARIFYCVAVAIIIEIRPHAAGAACLDSLRPRRQFVCRIIVAVPLFDSVESDVYLVRRIDQFVRQPRTAARAKDDATRTKGGKDSFIPPAAMSKLHDIPSGGVQL